MNTICVRGCLWLTKHSSVMSNNSIITRTWHFSVFTLWNWHCQAHSVNDISHDTSWGMNTFWSWWRYQMETCSVVKRGNMFHRSPMDSPHKGKWRGAFIFSLICAWTNGWVNNQDAGDLRHRTHFNATVAYSRQEIFVPNLLNKSTSSKHFTEI